MEQIGIVVLGGLSAWLTQDTRATWRKWACIFGLLGQPFWFVSAFKAGQAGIMAMCVWYTYVWARGVYNFWIKR